MKGPDDHAREHHGRTRRSPKNLFDTQRMALVFRQEAVELWVGGRAINMLILYSCLLGLVTFLLATNSELSLILRRRWCSSPCSTASRSVSSSG